MITNRLIEETERRFAQRQGIREENSRKIKAGLWLTADSRERVQKRWQRLASKAAVTEALTGVAVPAPPAVLPSVADAATARTLERVIGRSDLMSITYLELGLAVARAIGRVRIRGAGGQTLGFGTGFLVSPNLLLTNNHVLEDGETAANSRIEFNYQDDVTGRPLTVVTFDLDPATLFLTDEGLDFSLVAVRDTGGLGEFGWVRLIEEEGKAVIGDCLSIIQHPAGAPKQLALRDNELVDVLDRFLHYRTDTKQGSSGSPVFNDQWEVVALHHSGVPAKDRQGNWLATDGTRWTPDMGDDRRQWIANEGVRISRIVKHVRDQNLTGARGSLVSDMLSAESLTRRVGNGGSGSAKRSPPDVGGIVGGPEVGADGSIVWTLPLRVAVSLGSPAPLGSGRTPQPRVDVNGGDAKAAPARTAARDGAATKDADTNRGLQDALGALKESESREYYNKREDEAAQRSYYAGVPRDLDPGAFFDALSDLVSKTHERRPRYQPGKQLYPWVDLQPNKMLRSVYSGLEFDPAEAIREDFRIEAARERLRESLESVSEAARERATEEEEALEARLPYNCEHVVPQSWFAAQEPMRGDLHHLFACESKCNSFRGNTPYYDFPEDDEVFREECGERDQNRFEPVNGKGAVARATLYFLLRYPGEIDETRREYTRDRVDTLLTWHADYPPTVWERHRNAAIHAAQGNRNPFIDSPTWAAKVDFARGLGNGEERGGNSEAGGVRREFAGVGRMAVGDLPYRPAGEFTEAEIASVLSAPNTLVVSVRAPVFRVARQADLQGSDVIVLTGENGEPRGLLRPSDLRYRVATDFDMATPSLVTAVNTLATATPRSSDQVRDREIAQPTAVEGTTVLENPTTGGMMRQQYDRRRRDREAKNSSE